MTNDFLSGFFLGTTVSSSSAGAGPRIDESDGSDWHVQSGVILKSTTYSPAIAPTGNGHLLDLDGTAVGATGVRMGGTSLSTGNQLMVGETGRAYGSTYGVQLLGGVELVNDGIVKGGLDGVRHGLSGADATYTNHGSVVGQRTGIAVFGNTDGKLKVVNEGLIAGKEQAYWGSHNVDYVVNRGTMGGDVLLGTGNDVLDNRSGKVTGVIEGGDGNDRFALGLGVETANGGAGTDDVLDFRSGGGLVVSLADPAQNTGRAAGDSYTGFEDIWGSKTGNDTLTGDAASNELRGEGGADKLSGGGGYDTLVGGTGADTLRGGEGRDFFVFNSAAEGGDKILDYGGGDYLMIDQSGFGAGLFKADRSDNLDSSQFVVRATDNHAQNADHRFVFETDSARLWFDADGNGAGAAKLVADLQAGAELGAGDLILI